MLNAKCLMSKGPDLVRQVRFVLPLGIVHLALCIVVVIALPVRSTAAQASQPSLDVVLSRLFAYVEQFQRDFGSMVAEERYDQTVRQNSSFSRGETRRVLRSDFLLVNVPGQGWLPFRDVFEAEGRQIRDREDRLTALFLSGATSNALEQARRIMDEGSRYNLGGGTRNINVPTLALMYLGPDMRSGVRFADAGAGRDDDGRIIEFTEFRRPTLIATTGNRDLPARGRIWVDETTGTITRTELHADDTGVEAQVSVWFELEPTINTWVPKRMEDRFKRRGDTSEVRGVATYSRFRRFQVSTSEELAPPDGERKP
jgi:hypothetical protein